ncbi:MAG: hypothetical protein ACFFC7_21780 [Candidatus Hermodarchaeota archaeon]
MADRELKLNSISRFSKKSPRLVLEQYSHCEVPAGCGGVVIRWKDPQDLSTKVFIRIYNINGDLILNGNQHRSGLALVVYGEQQVLAFHISNFQPGYGSLMFAAIYQKNREESQKILSLPDGTWKYSLNKPLDDSWMHAGFDDTSWFSMVLRPFPQPDTQSYSYQILQELGAQELGIKNSDISREIWVRKEFNLSREREI